MSESPINKPDVSADLLRHQTSLKHVLATEFKKPKRTTAYTVNKEVSNESLDQEELSDLDENSPATYEATIVCPGCKVENLFQFQTMFEKVTCSKCRSTFRIPVETEEFIFDKHILEMPLINIFRAHNKENDFYGDVVVYERTEEDESKLGDLIEVVKKFSQVRVQNYLSPLYFQVDPSAYYISREKAHFPMNLYLKQYGALSKSDASTILNQITHIILSLAKQNIYGDLIPSDLMLNDQGIIQVSDYGLRNALFTQMNIQDHLPLSYLAPETVHQSSRNEASVVYSLGLLAITLLSGANPFQELDPEQVEDERENYLENFKDTKLPSFLKLMIKTNPADRPPLMQCGDFFIRLSRQSKR
ncbi:protein kinase [Lentisphaera profundi]|uniref:Protein kinase n=1 Tax=Lentisphaera profundi TaxID=1658616 RepID=A0ABY7VNL6_9BACT|nr:protein kinase [Lentisphaera profundi]WDE95356.1 protein kinase [Lentisphaera profundi]